MHTLSPPLPAADDLEMQRLILRDGSVAIVRPAGPSDRGAMRRLKRQNHHAPWPPWHSRRPMKTMMAQCPTMKDAASHEHKP